MLVLFDGDCHFCNYWVRFILSRDQFRSFKFAPLALAPELPQDSLVVVQNGEYYYRSEAVFRILEGLGTPKWFTELLRKLPRPLRDAVYNFIADRRYFISKIVNLQSGSVCPLPSPWERQKFIYHKKDLGL
jgi:predicted DCC family thiol-disulfide oxidoreductase YuxK